MKKLLNNRFQKDDSGIAIMFSLMMLAVFLVLGMGFSAYMTNIRRGAEFQKDLYLNDGVEKVILAQVTAAIKGFFSPISDSSIEYYNSIPEASSSFFGDATFEQVTPATGNDEDHVFKTWGIDNTDANIANSLVNLNWINTQDNAEIDTNFKGSFSSPTGADLGWQEHKVNSNNANDPNYAISNWFIIGMSGRLDPLVYDSDSGYDERAQADDISKINLSNIVIDPTHANNLTSKDTGDVNRWTSLTDIHEKMLDGGITNDTAYYAFFPIDSGTNSDTNETLDGSTIPTTTDKSGLISPNALFNLTNVATSTPNVIVSSIPYLNNGTLTTEQKIQIAANIRDYCDPDDNAESDYTTPTGTPPTYVGNEKVPYLNKLVIDLVGSWGDYDTDGGNDFLGYKLGFYGELIDLYASSKASQMLVTFTINIEDGASNTLVDESLSQTATINFSASGAAAYITATTALTNSDLVKDVSGQSATARITITNLILLDSGGSNLYDYANINDKWPDLFIDNGNTFSVSTECIEPKNNLSTSSWEFISTPGGGYGTGAGNTFKTGQKNDTWATAYAAVANDQKDYEPQALVSGDPLDLSTNYIRNNSIQNLHELGYIHRSINYQTLNLIEYNTGSEDAYFGQGDNLPDLPGIANYSNSGTDQLYTSNSASGGDSGEDASWSSTVTLSDGGDRSILNYVSIDGAEESVNTQGLINPNTSHPHVLVALFSDLQAYHPHLNGRVGDLAAVSNKTTQDEITQTELYSLLNLFPGIDPSNYNSYPSTPPSEGYFDAFWFKNRVNNPPSYGIPFKKSLEAGILNDRQAEVLLCNTRRFVSANRNTYIGALRARIAENITLAGSDIADPYVGGGSETLKQFYLFRELIDINSTPHNPSDDIYRVRTFKEVTR
ncbi:hypothetical protein PQO03_20405 [Lentisphaera profundi]|uniref:Type 4 fimbrial biogenesis protein PilX N-terminal domain-containing protein n=1 Tax=Lentisphaera profundi TaxID=1658616 RepID=A0ABY7VWT2_9BACT|nr:hypothetical protein [Lentisphaera profundi]WDE98182.1 hypothetical protein PQO03_20405 [Lentisphaera profundi]